MKLSLMTRQSGSAGALRFMKWRKFYRNALLRMRVVQLKGGISFSNVKSYAWESLSLFAKAYQTLPKYLPLPLVFDNPIISEMVEHDRHIKNILETGKQAQVAIFTVGSVNDDSLLFRLGYFTEEEKQQLKEKAVGDVCSRFIDANGQICDENINNRTVSIDLEELCKKDRSILVAGGTKKTTAIHAVLSSGYANALITDQHTAKKLLNM